jgi:hypothetical protein|tara:strand:+ start:480 stop:644 length:165 start_codon:yes stop_codon:yes gene_type:complete
MQEINLNLPPEIASWLFEGGTAWRIELIDPHPKNTPLIAKYSSGSIVTIIGDKK